jgi:stage V sporulation protein S
MAAPEEVILRVGSRTPVPELASAISHGVYDSKTVLMRAIGAGAIGQAIKGLAVARGYVAPRGFDLALIPGFVDIVLPDGTVTGMTLKVFVLNR